jgi:transcriptional regulator with XRE-family HTH domain
MGGKEEPVPSPEPEQVPLAAIPRRDLAGKTIREVEHFGENTGQWGMVYEEFQRREMRPSSRVEGWYDEWRYLQRADLDVPAYFEEVLRAVSDVYAHLDVFLKMPTVQPEWSAHKGEQASAYCAAAFRLAHDSTEKVLSRIRFIEQIAESFQPDPLYRMESIYLLAGAPQRNIRVVETGGLLENLVRHSEGLASWLESNRDLPPSIPSLRAIAELLETEVNPRLFALLSAISPAEGLAEGIRLLPGTVDRAAVLDKMAGHQREIRAALAGDPAGKVVAGSLNVERLREYLNFSVEMREAFDRQAIDRK